MGLPSESTLLLSDETEDARSCSSCSSSPPEAEARLLAAEAEAEAEAEEDGPVEEERGGGVFAGVHLGSGVTRWCWVGPMSAGELAVMCDDSCWC